MLDPCWPAHVRPPGLLLWTMLLAMNLWQRFVPGVPATIQRAKVVQHHRMKLLGAFKFVKYESLGETLPAIGSVVLLQQRQNAGYAAGNNAGMRLLMRCGADAIWILNNDTVVDKRALSAMQKRLFFKARPGLCGSLVLYFGTDVVQCRAGGKTNP